MTLLVLSRKLGEKILIDIGTEKIVITAVDIDRGKCRIGIEASKGIKIWREEIAPEGVMNNGKAQ